MAPLQQKTPHLGKRAGVWSEVGGLYPASIHVFEQTRQHALGVRFQDDVEQSAFGILDTDARLLRQAASPATDPCGNLPRQFEADRLGEETLKPHVSGFARCLNK